MKQSIGIILLLGAAAGCALAQDASVQQAVRWERTKDAAAARQARIETSKPAEVSKHAVKTDNSEQDAVLWERAKDGAAARPAQVEGEHSHTGNVAAANTKKK